MISIHAPARGATEDNDRSGATENFNPRSREGSDVALKLITEDSLISIHAPARGATAGGDAANS